MSSPRRRSKSPPGRTDDSSQRKTMAYFLKDRPEGVPMPVKTSPSKPSSSPRRPYNTRSSQSKQTQPSGSQQPKSISQIVAPQIKVVDGKVVLDESRPLTREDLTAGMSVVQEEQNRYFTSATYSKRSAGANRWSQKESDLFFEALSMCGTDFSMIATLFPHRTRNQIKGKYKVEERNAPHRISTALTTQKPLDSKAFANRLARALHGNKSN